MDEFLELASGDEFVFHPSISIVEAAERNGGLTLVVEFLIRPADAPRELWVVECETVREYRVGIDRVRGVELLADHVLLAPYRDSWVTLAIHGPVRDVRHAIADLWQAHYEVAEDWFPLTRFLRWDFPKFLQVSGSIIAEGPSRLLTAYQRVLAMNGTDAYMPWERPAPEATDLSLLLLPPHFVIGSGFRAHRREPGQ